MKCSLNVSYISLTAVADCTSPASYSKYWESWFRTMKLIRFRQAATYSVFPLTMTVSSALSRSNLMCWCLRQLYRLLLTGFEPAGHGDVPGRHHQHHGTRHFHTERFYHTHIPAQQIHTYIVLGIRRDQSFSQTLCVCILNDEGD